MYRQYDRWIELLTSVERRRWRGALYYKPACLLAVLGGIDAGEIDPQNLDADVVFSRFERLVVMAAPERSQFGWRPFWHLSNDGAWQFFRGERQVVPDDYGPERKPNSKTELLNRIDRVSVRPEDLALWRYPPAREALRQALLNMLRADDNNVCTLLAEQFDTPRTVQPHVRRESIDCGQGFIASPESRRAIEAHAMAVVKSYLRSAGWDAHDVSLTRPYDLDCFRGSDRRYVEVKGTTSNGSKVFLTAGEVGFARQHRGSMTLAIVSGIELVTDEGVPRATSGSLRMVWDWMVATEDLSPVSYSYLVPASAHDPIAG